jgi:asparagine synthase (glutamine-hydrolysing)
MCGICGIFDLNGNPVDRDLLSRMTRAMAHRGPDGTGEIVAKHIGLGHRRLSIIDVSGGAQPIGNETGSIQVVFNGEIYNYVELREELRAAGHVFLTTSDTEVIVHGYEEWGRDCVRRFNGMFAFALWDSAKADLFVARDHLGIKPLYYARIGSIVLLASEIKALLAYPRCPRTPDIDALSELFTYRYVPSPKTLFKGISKLPAAHWMVLSEGKQPLIRRFWHSTPGPCEGTVAMPELIEEYVELVEDAVRIQMRSDVPLGLFLSSGVDSAALLSLMRQHASGRVQTFTIGFEGGERTNEVRDAEKIARDFGADHYAQILTPNDYIAYYERYMSDLEEPVGNETAAAFYFVARLASSRVKVALTGQGADEPWAGYHRYVGIRESAWYSRLPSWLTAGVAKAVGLLPGRLERLKRGFGALGERDVLTRLARVYSFFGPEMKTRLYKGEMAERLQQDIFGTRFALQRLQEDVQHLDPLTQMLYIDVRASLPDDLLMVSDKTSMACSLESRVPYLDTRIVEFVERLPTSLKLRGFVGKYLHKRACAKWLPKEIIYRKKKGFENPIAQWVRDRMRPYVEDCLLGKDSAMACYFDQTYIRRILDLDRAGVQQYRRHIYLLLSLEIWHRTFIGRGAS